MGEDPIDLSRRYCEEFHHDMAYLNCLPPSVEPRVSDHMLQIIDMIKQVITDHSFMFVPSFLVCDKYHFPHSVWASIF